MCEPSFSLYSPVLAIYLKCIITEGVACPNYTKFNTTLPLVLSNQPTVHEVDQVNGSRDV